MDKWHEFLRLMFSFDPDAMADPRYLGLLGITLVFSTALTFWLKLKHDDLGPSRRLAISLAFGLTLGAFASASYVGLL